MSNGHHVASLTLDAYHERTEWSHSQLEDFLESPPLFHGRHIAKTFPRIRSDAMDDGTIVHAVLAGGADVSDIVACIPDEVLSNGARRGKAWQEWSAANADKIQRKAAEMQPLLLMVDSVRTHDKARWLLDATGHTEHSIMWTDDDTGLELRCRPDKLCISPPRVCDIKTTRVTDHHGFSSHIAKYGYHRQAAFYIDGVRELGIESQGFCFITVDKTPAHECHVYDLVPAAIELGRQQNRELLRELAWRVVQDKWDSRDEGAIIEIDVPTWEYNTQVEWRVVT